MFFSRRPTPFRDVKGFANQIRCVPIRNVHVKSEDDPMTGHLHVEVPLKYPWILEWLARRFDFKRIDKFYLDGISRDLYLLIDDKRNLEFYIDSFMETHKLTFFEARGLLIGFFHALMEKKLIAIVLPNDALEQKPESEQQSETQSQSDSQKE